VDMSRSLATPFLFPVNSPALLVCMLCTRRWLSLGGDGKDVELIGNKRYAFLLLPELSVRWRTSLEGKGSVFELKVDIFELCTDG